MEISLRINELIQNLGFNKSSFASKIGVSQPIITHITNGRNNPGLEVIQKILTHCPEVNPEWLVMGTGEMVLNLELKRKMIKDLYSDIYIQINTLEKSLTELKEKANLLENYLQ